MFEALFQREVLVALDSMLNMSLYQCSRNLLLLDRLARTLEPIRQVLDCRFLSDNHLKSLNVV